MVPLPATPGEPLLTAHDDAEIFELAPISLWAEDYSGLRRLFRQWRAAGVTDLLGHLRDDPRHIRQCIAAIRIVKVNRRTLTMFGAADLAALNAHLNHVMGGNNYAARAEELLQLWQGATSFAFTGVGYALDGRRLDVRVNTRIMPGHEATWSRVLVALEDVTAEQQALRQLRVSETYARGLFEQSPVSLWVEDFSVIKRRLDGLRAKGVLDLRRYIELYPEFVRQCVRDIRLIDINQQSLPLFAAPDKTTLLNRIPDIFRDDILPFFTEELIELWQGRLQQQHETVLYTLSGERLNLFVQLSVMPGCEPDWSMMLVSLTDITARKRAEASLEYLGKHDVLTGLFNRAYFLEQVDTLERHGPFPVTVIMADLDGLKTTNDTHGHAAGDTLLRRASGVLQSAVAQPHWAARIGGDEFVVLMTDTDQPQGAAVIGKIEAMVEADNRYHRDTTLRFSMGLATCYGTACLDATVRQADLLMYETKRARYAAA